MPRKTRRYDAPPVCLTFGRRGSNLQKSCLLASSSVIRAEEEGRASCARGSVSVPLATRRSDTPGPCSGRIYVVDPGQPHPERSDNRTPEYSQSRNSPPSPVSPPPTFSYRNSLLSFTGLGVLRYPQDPHLPPPTQSPCLVPI